MTNAKMSKTGVAWIAFLSCNLLGIVAMQPAFSQTAESGSAIPELTIRGSIAEEEPLSRAPAGNQDPIVLGLEDFQSREPNTDETFDAGSNADETVVNSAEERRGQLTRTGDRTIDAPSGRRGRVQAVGPVGVDPDDPTSSPRSNVAADPRQTGNRPVTDEEPFGPTGFRLGTIDVLASIEQSLGYSTNISQNAGGESGGFSQTDIEVTATSNWSRHELQSSLTGSYRLPFDGEEVDEPSLSANTQLRLDLIDGHTLTGVVFYEAETQEFTDTTLAPGAVDTPLEQSFGGSLELERSDRRLFYSLRGSVSREVFEDADLGGGVTQLQEDQNNNEYTFTLRTGYEVSPAIRPFIEGAYGFREFDLETDRNGNQRDSNIYALRTGAEIDLGEKLQGEFAVGYLTEQADDPLIEDLSGFTVSGELNWTPERDTLVTWTVDTQSNNSIALNENGSFTYSSRLNYERQITDRLSVDAFGSVEFETNDARNTTVELGVGAQYWVNRFMAVTGDIEYQRFSSDAANSGFDEVSGRVGMRLQR
ncbi:MAG: outer membrane beta-barrel protein [Pseudomonadota bacterium]